MTDTAQVVEQVMRDLGYNKQFQWSWDMYRDVAKSIGTHLRDDAKLLEVGAGRSPLLSPDDLKDLGFELCINDIVQSELDLSPYDYQQYCFDVAGDSKNVEEFHGQFDFIFSKMVLEHVDSTEQAWRNMRAILSEGGVAFSYFPVLYCIPFVVNKYLPEELASKLLHSIVSKESKKKINKFPAHYDHCVASKKVLGGMLERAGFTRYEIYPFWGHGYYHNIPVVRNISSLVTRVAKRAEIKTMASYVYVFAYK